MRRAPSLLRFLAALSSTLATLTLATGIAGAADLTAIEVTPVDPSVPAGRTLQLVAIATFSDGTTADVTDDATWASSDRAVARVSNAVGSEGLATGIASGAATISAQLDGVSGATTLTVTDPTLVAIEITPASARLAVDFTLQYTATGLFSDGSSQDLSDRVTWSSSDLATARISNAAGSAGLATGLAPGMTNIGARFDGVTGATTLVVTNATLVSVAVVPSNPSVAAGSSLQFTAIGTFSDGSSADLTDQGSWASNTGAVASVSNATGSKGLATGLAAGTSTILMELDGITGSTTLTVTASVCGARPFVCKAAGKASLRIENRMDDRRDRFEFTWARGDATTMAELGDPTRDTQYAVCVWDDVGGTPTLVMEMVAPPAGSCIGRSCWRPTGYAHGFRYFDAGLLPNGLREIAVKPGPLGRSRVVVKALGDAMPDPPMPFRRDPVITVQVVNSAGACWGADFVNAPTTNTATKLVAQERP